MFTGKADSGDNPDLNTPVGLTSVKILDYDETMFINFEAEINYPCDHFPGRCHVPEVVDRGRLMSCLSVLVR